MQVDFFGTPVRCETDGLMVSLTDLAKAGNQWRALNSAPYKPLALVTQSKEFAEFVACAERDMPGRELVRVDGRGNTKRTMAHVTIAVYVAEQFSVDFHYKVIKTFVEGKLLEFRDHGGTEFVALNAAIDMHLPGRAGKDNKGCFVQTALKLRKKILGTESPDWNTASVAQTYARFEAEQLLVKALRLGLVRDWDHLKELIGKL